MVSDVRKLAKVPVPVPLVVLEFAVVGFGAVLQHIPRAVTGEPPSLVILPPLKAEVVVMEVIAVVDKVGFKVEVAKVTSFP